MWELWTEPQPRNASGKVMQYALAGGRDWESTYVPE
jgi:hypothetical protein